MTISKVKILAGILLASSGIFLPLALRGQSTFGSIVGTVEDASGSVVADAAIAIKSLDENTSRASTSDAGGVFQVLNLRPHREERASTVNIVAEDHLSLAGFFRDLASQEQELAESYEHIAALYKENAPPQRLGPATETENQYRHLADIERRAAKLTASLADYHSRLAEVSHALRRANPSFSSFGK
jgi:carboxypeptidase family protein